LWFVQPTHICGLYRPHIFATKSQLKHYTQT
jgi:hypothetical protein